jgi:hypothetical protein
MTQSHSSIRLALSLAAASVMFGARTASAAECTDRVCTATNTVQVHVGTILRLSLQGSALVVARADARTIQSGGETGAGPSAVVRSNGAWKLHISAAQEIWTPMDSSARLDKPATDLTWSTHSTDGFSSLSTGPSQAAQGGPTGGTTLPLYYRTRFAPTIDTPGAYSMVVRLTLVGA